MNESQYSKEKVKEEICYLSIVVLSLFFSALITGLICILSRISTFEFLKKHEPLEYFLFSILLSAIVFYLFERSVVKDINGKS